MFSRLRLSIAAALAALVLVACGGGPVGDDGDDDDNRPDGGFTNPGGGDGGTNPTNCTSDVIPMPTTAACAAATLTCIEACTTDECSDTCLAADPNADNCGVCLEDGWISCANSMGCQAQWDAVICCYEDCADPESPACDSTCSAESAAYDTCAEAHDDACSASTDAICFMQ
jgi:hypothetical protein